MPRPLREPDIRSPTKIQNTFATPVGADLCVGPLRATNTWNPAKIPNKPVSRPTDVSAKRGLYKSPEVLV